MKGSGKGKRGSKEARRLEKVERLLSSILKLDGRLALLVEGRRDRESLRKLGVEGEVFCLLDGKGSLPERLEKLDAERVLVLVDFDPEGQRLARFVSHYLTRRGVDADLSVWRGLKSCLGGEVRDVEGLANYLARRSGGARRRSRAAPRASQ